MRKITAVAIAVAGLVAAPGVASAQVLCAIPLLVMGAYTGATEHRELTQKEAMWCGLYHETQPAKEVKAKPHKTMKKTKAQ
ncbi:MAG: hypothetical protein OJF62_000875 [Pseudolabrys sp.]|jgi:hypothetical protein|nr:hypothetical protein [Pseudolabrys sp.]